MKDKEKGVTSSDLAIAEKGVAMAGVEVEA